MEMIKQHLFVIICSVVGACGIALGMTGLGKMSEVTDEMEEVKRLYDSLARQANRGINQRWVEEEKKRIDQHKKNYKAVVAHAKTLNPYKPFHDKVFPNGRAEDRNAFRQQYLFQMEALMAKLKAGRPPSNNDIMLVSEEIILEQAQLDSAANTAGESDYHPNGVLTALGAARSPAARAAISRARTIYCYAKGLDAETPALHFHRGMDNPDALGAADAEDCWFAQVHLWIQTDVVDAMASVNDGAAKKLVAQGVNPWVGILPIKDFISLRVSDEYVSERRTFSSGSGAGVASDRDIAYPPGAPGLTMTGSYTDADCQFLVLYFSLRIVMDQRLLPKLIERICNDRFHSLLQVSYRAVEPNPAMTGRIYGADPVVLVTMDFETHMLGSLFINAMPDEVYNQHCAE